MEESKTTNPRNSSKEERNDTPGCVIWIFGDDQSADHDVKSKFEIRDEENQGNA